MDGWGGGLITDPLDFWSPPPTEREVKRERKGKGGIEMGRLSLYQIFDRTEKVPCCWNYFFVFLLPLVF